MDVDHENLFGLTSFLVYKSHPSLSVLNNKEGVNKHITLNEISILII